MKKKRTTYDEAVEQFGAFFGKCPTVNEINELYHKYSCDWKHFNGFTDWLIYHAE